LSFVKRKIDLIFTKGPGEPSFTGTSGNTLTVTGCRVQADINFPGDAALNQCDLAVYGLSLSQINDLSTLGSPIIQDRHNSIQIKAGDDTNGMHLAYQGDIARCWGDFASQPEVCMRVFCMVGQSGKVQVSTPTNYEGSVDPVVILQTICDKLGYTLVNWGVEGLRVTDPYLSSNPMEQLWDVKRMNRFNMAIEGDTVTIWPMGGYRTTPTTPVISKDNGMVGYPTYNPVGIDVTIEYTPSIVIGGLLNVKSTLGGTGQLWKVKGMSHALQSETNGGAWFTHLALSDPALVVGPS
jgi:hypothetical protein